MLVLRGIRPDTAPDGLGNVRWRRGAAAILTATAALVLSSCSSSPVAESTVKATQAATAPVEATPETNKPVGKYDSSVTANMTPEKITQYYHLPAGDINKPTALMNDFTAANEGIANIGCSKLVWDKYGGDAHADINAVGDQIVTGYVNPAIDGVFGKGYTRDPSFPRLAAIACSETRLQTIIDQVKRPDFHVSDVADTATLKVTKNPDDTIKSMSWSVNQSNNLDPAVAKGMGWDTSGGNSATISYTIGDLQVKKGADGSSYLEVGSFQ